MSFSEPPFHRLPVTEHLRGTTPKSLASPFLPRCVILALFLVLQCLALLTHPSVPGICALSSGEADATAPKGSSHHHWAPGAAARLSCCPSQPSSHLRQSILDSERHLERLCEPRHSMVSKRLKTRVLLSSSPTTGCTKIPNMKGSRASQKLLVHSGQHSEKQML